MNEEIKNNCILYCNGIINTYYQKTVKNIIKYSHRYSVVCLIDPTLSSDQISKLNLESLLGVPVLSNVEESVKYAKSVGVELSHFVIGIGNRYEPLNNHMTKCILNALEKGFKVDSGLFDKLNEIKEIHKISKKQSVVVNDIRYLNTSHYNLSREDILDKVESVIIAVLGTDNYIGTELTAFVINEYLMQEGYFSSMIGSSISSWMLGINNCVFHNSLLNEFIPSIIENKIYSLWRKDKPHFIVIEGPGSLLNPVSPCGLEILVAGSPDIIVLQHSPKRKFYLGSNEVQIHSIQRHIKAIEAVSGKSISAIALNTENVDPIELDNLNRKIKMESDIPVYEINVNGLKRLVKHIINVSGRISYKKVKFHRRIVQS